jgi:AcrR family transcriptional regulator
LLAFATRVPEGLVATKKTTRTRAGVSVGSLYQYVPSKDAIAVELLRRYRERLVSVVGDALGSADEKTFPAAVHTLISALLRAEGINPALHRVLIEQVLRTNARGELIGFEEKLESVVADALLRAKGQVGVADVHLASFVVVRVVLAMVHAAVVDRPAINQPALAGELTRLVLRYLAP